MVACLRNLRLLTDFWVKAFQDTALSLTLPAVAEVRDLATVSREGDGGVNGGVNSNSLCWLIECLSLVAVRMAPLFVFARPASTGLSSGL